MFKTTCANPLHRDVKMSKLDDIIIGNELARFLMGTTFVVYIKKRSVNIQATKAIFTGKIGYAKRDYASRERGVELPSECYIQFCSP